MKNLFYFIILCSFIVGFSNCENKFQKREREQKEQKEIEATIAREKDEFEKNRSIALHNEDLKKSIEEIELERPNGHPGTYVNDVVFGKNGTYIFEDAIHHKWDMTVNGSNIHLRDRSNKNKIYYGSITHQDANDRTYVISFDQVPIIWFGDGDKRCPSLKFSPGYYIYKNRYHSTNDNPNDRIKIKRFTTNVKF